MRYPASLIFVLFFTLTCGYAQHRSAGTASTTSRALDSMESSVIRLVNEHRAAMNLPPLLPDSVLSGLARTHSRKVAFDHVGFDSREKAYKKARKLSFVGMFGENIAEGQESAEGVVDTWLTSEGHKRNIEGSYQYIGVGIIRAKDGNLYFTQLFASR